MKTPLGMFYKCLEPHSTCKSHSNIGMHIPPWNKHLLIRKTQKGISGMKTIPGSTKCLDSCTCIHLLRKHLGLQMWFRLQGMEHICQRSLDRYLPDKSWNSLNKVDICVLLDKVYILEGVFQVDMYTWLKKKFPQESRNCWYNSHQDME